MFLEMLLFDFTWGLWGLFFKGSVKDKERERTKHSGLNADTTHGSDDFAVVCAMSARKAFP